VTSVSIVIPSYNHAAFIGDAVRSVLGQTFSDLELIVIDDGSRDATPYILRQLAATDTRIRLIVRTNRGAAATINEGVQMAKGRWIGILNSDDSYAPTRVERMLSVLAAAPAAWGFSRVGFIDEHGEPDSSPETHTFREIQDEVLRWPTVGFCLLKQNIALTTGNIFFEQRLYHEAGPFSDLNHVHDWDFALRLLRLSEPVFLDEELYFYRFHGRNTFRNITDYVTGRETSFLMRDFLLSVMAEEPLNPKCPSPYNWPCAFDMAIDRLGYEPYMPSAQEQQFFCNRRPPASLTSH
jgi:glycosyltransferase involved in cell wall biosynthesis